MLAALEDDFREAGLEPHRVAMLEYVEKLTLTPGTMQRADVEALVAAGFSDTDVLHIAEVAAYYAYVNRIADGLGVEIEDEDENDASRLQD